VAGVHVVRKILLRALLHDQDRLIYDQDRRIHNQHRWIYDKDRLIYGACQVAGVHVVREILVRVSGRERNDRAGVRALPGLRLGSTDIRP